MLLPSKLVSKSTLMQFFNFATSTEKELNEIETEFNNWSTATTTEAANIQFVTFMEEVYMHTYCEVCGTHYHNDEPCLFH